MMRCAVILIASLFVLAVPPSSVRAAEGVELPEYEWPHGGVFGTYDRAAAQRGFQVYQQVCSTCHSLDLVPFRALAGIGFTEDQIKEIAAQYQITDGPDEWGEMFQRPGKPSDYFPAPFPNEQAARAANGGGLPPDLSVIVKARKGHENYIVALLNGYKEPPPDFNLMPGMSYNEYFPGHQILMPQMLYGYDVEYVDGTEATLMREAKDIATFLTFVSHPHMEERKELGVRTILFLIVLSGLLFACKRALWSDIKH